MQFGIKLEINLDNSIYYLENDIVKECNGKIAKI